MISHNKITQLQKDNKKVIFYELQQETAITLLIWHYLGGSEGARLISHVPRTFRINYNLSIGCSCTDLSCKFLSTVINTDSLRLKAVHPVETRKTGKQYFGVCFCWRLGWHRLRLSSFNRPRKEFAEISEQENNKRSARESPTSRTLFLPLVFCLTFTHATVHGECSAKRRAKLDPRTVASLKPRGCNKSSELCKFLGQPAVQS